MYKPIARKIVQELDLDINTSSLLIAEDEPELVTKINRELCFISLLEDVNKISYNDTNKKILINTEQINITDEQGNMFVGNKYTIELDIDYNSVKIRGEKGYRGYWSDEDPHPHVSGSSGAPCLGDISSSIAYSLEEKDYYCALLLVLDFLKQVNVEDSAGKYIKHYTQIDEDGNEIENIYIKYKKCVVCSDMVLQEDAYVCIECGGYVCEEHSYKTVNSDYICEDCIEGDYIYHYCDDCGRVINENEDYYTLSVDEENYYCLECTDKLDRCSKCERVINRYNHSEEIEDELFCEFCIDELEEQDRIQRCEECGEYFFKKNMINGYCESCYSTIEDEIDEDEEETEEKINISQCEICGEEMTEEYISSYGEIICKNCFDNGRGC